MSLIADALKKAQSTRFGRRYMGSEPTGVLPVVREGYGGGAATLTASLSKVNLSPTLLMGLGAGVLVFVILVTYVLYGRSPKAKSQAMGSQIAVQKGLILTAPPATALDLPSDTKDSRRIDPPSKVAVAKPIEGDDSLSALSAGRVDMAKTAAPADTLQTTPKSKRAEPAKRGEVSNVAVAADMSEEVRRSFNLALFYQEERNFTQARREYERVIQLWPLYAEAYNNLGVVYKELGMYDEGVSQIKKALALNPRYTRAYHNLGVIYQLKGDFKQATKNYETALSLDRKNISSYNNLGLVYRAEKKPHQARELLEKALSIDSSSSQTHYNLALVLEEVGELDAARFHFQKFIDLSGDGNRLLAERVQAHLQRLLAKK